MNAAGGLKWFCVVGAAVVLAIAISASAAAPRAITGKLSRGGYTVIAVAANGSATSVKTRSGSFALRPTAGSVTLHLRGANGRYAGPIVVGGKGARAIVGVKVGARLGKVVVRTGFARPARPLRKKWLVTSRWAKARRGVPIGARVFGYVRTTAPGVRGPGLDRDRDGVPDALDVDDDGDLVLDNLDRTPGSATASGMRQAQAPPHTALASLLNVPLGDTVNANASALSDAQIDAALSTHGVLRIGHQEGGETELDCGGLTYCSPGGTGKITFAGPEQPFPSCCDADTDGFGTMPVGYGPTQFYLRHGATTGRIRTGDVLIQRYPEGGTEKQVAVTLQTVFATVPAVTSYSDGAGHSATFTYPVEHPNIPLRASAGAGGDVVLTFTFWRPQRKPIAEEGGEWIDIGGLFYHVEYFHPDFPPVPGVLSNCLPSTYATADPNLEPATEPFSPGGGFRDRLIDQASNPSNTLTFSVNITDCLASSGRSWDPGRLLFVHLQAGGTGSDHAFQGLHFTRVS